MKLIKVHQINPQRRNNEVMLCNTNEKTHYLFFVVISLVDIDKDKITFHIFIISDWKVKYLTEPDCFEESDRSGGLWIV
jgi:hypothetical protein